MTTRERPEIQAFIAWAETNGFCLDQHILPPGDPSNPFLDDDTIVAFEAFCAGRESAPRRAGHAAVRVVPRGDRS